MDEIFTCTAKYVIDRIESGRAVLEDAGTLDIITLAAVDLPHGAKPGHTVVNVNGKWQIDHDDTNARKQRISEKFARIKAISGHKKS